MSGAGHQAVARRLTERHGRTYAVDAGIRMKDTPQPLYQLLVLSSLLSARIRASVAVSAARQLFAAGLRAPGSMASATWQQRVDALGEGGYRRYDERTATQLGTGAELLRDGYRGDLRRMRDAVDGDRAALRGALQEVPGIGPAGSAIFLREVQGVWQEFAPFLDEKALRGAGRLGLPEDPAKLAGLVGAGEIAGFAAGLVRAALDQHVVDDVREASG
ncbi:endonuclease [Streptomyces pinistramenti]|uniref:endonuclease n=1 Tax=Streptomyces pinistramenti TaxID=2884812 RepID=UPI001D08BD8F|nr:endonuclease [Streptomyces pinistramenti]MCB5906244.1 endonuclease [Streptomyces pinistramenti]